MGEIDDALERASAELFTRQPPKTPLAQMRLLAKAEKGNTAAVAARLGVTRRTVERYLAGQRKHPRTPLREALARETAKVWQPRVRQRRRRKAATTTGVTIEFRGRVGYTAPIGTTDDPRLRRLTVHLPLTTPPASSKPRTRAPATRPCARSPPRASKRSTSRTTAAAPGN